MPDTVSLASLGSSLPKGRSYTWVHFHTNAYKCKAPAAGADGSYKAKHLFLLGDDASSAIVFGVEVYVYFTLHQQHMTRHIFVPKADTTGLGSRFSAAAVMETFMGHVLSLPISFYFKKDAKSENSNGNGMLEENIRGDESITDEKGAKDSDLATALYRMGQKLSQQGAKPVPPYEVSGKPVAELPLPPILDEKIKLSMFTKAADAYLFPDSHKNTAKHVASGNDLFKWWLTVLQRAVCRIPGWEVRADIPGSDAAAVKRLLPAGCSFGSIYPSDEQVLPTIPVFPDDPKGRFLEHLVVESRVSHMSVAQFWHELGYRQEFRLGNVVGIIGAQGPPFPGTSSQDSTLVSVKKYKKLRDYVKGQDYSKADEVQEMWSRGLGEMCVRQKVKLRVEQVLGTREATSHAGVSRDTPVNVLQARKRPVNNISGLVKRKK